MKKYIRNIEIKKEKEIYFLKENTWQGKMEKEKSSGRTNIYIYIYIINKNKNRIIIK